MKTTCGREPGQLEDPILFACAKEIALRTRDEADAIVRNSNHGEITVVMGLVNVHGANALGAHQLHILAGFLAFQVAAEDLHGVVALVKFQGGTRHAGNLQLRLATATEDKRGVILPDANDVHTLA